MWHTRSRHYGRWDLIVEGIRHCLLIGNSRWHWATKISGNWHFFHTEPNPQSISFPSASLLTWASVGPIPKSLSLNPDKKLSINDVPLKNLPSWLGIDRALAGWGAWKKAKSSESKFEGLIVADAGTILSITLVNSNGEFAGGQLIAGLQLQLSSMAYGAHNLHNPGLHTSQNELFPVKTADAMQRGSLQALVGALLQAKNTTKLPLWICGGDSPVLIKELRRNNVAFTHYPNLVLEGMVDIHEQINLGPNLSEFD